MKRSQPNASTAARSRIGSWSRAWYALPLLLLGCSSGPSGEYSDESGILKYEFKSGNKVYMTTMGMQFAGEYEMDDGKVIVKGPNGNMVFEMGDDDTLQGPMGMVLKKKGG